MLKARNSSLPGYQRETSWSESFWFVVGADTQLGLEEEVTALLENRKAQRLCWQIELKRIKHLIDFVNSCHILPRFVIVCGDLVNAFPWEDQRSQQEQDLINSFKTLHTSVPMICVCGNHDVGNSPTSKTISNYREKFGDEFFSFWVAGTFHIVINSQYFVDDSQCSEESKQQMQWLEEQLKIAGTAKHAFAYQHVPPFLQNPQENKQYFNLDQETRTALLDKLCKAGVSKLFCGHYHSNAGGWYPSDSERLLEVVVTTAIGCQLGSDTELPGLIDAWPEKRTRPAVRFVTVEESVSHHKLQGIEDLRVGDS